MIRSRQQKAFTLLELIIAVGIFGVVYALAFPGLNKLLFSKEIVDAELQRLSNIQRTMLYLSRDLEQAAARPTRDELGSSNKAFTGGQNIDSTLFELTRFGWRNPVQKPRSSLQRVAYSFEDNQLIRLYWHHLDHLQTDEPVRKVLLDGVEKIDIRYLDKEWVNNWPRQALNENETTPALPKAVEIIFEFDDWGEVKRLFRVAS